MRRMIDRRQPLSIPGTIKSLRPPNPSRCMSSKYQDSTCSATRTRTAQLSSTAKKSATRRIWTRNQTLFSDDTNTSDAGAGRNMSTGGADIAQNNVPVYRSEHYEPASTWDELERVGTLMNAWDEAWEDVTHFEGFPRRQTLTNAVEITSAFQRAVVQVVKKQPTRMLGTKSGAAVSGQRVTIDVHTRSSSIGIELASDGLGSEQVNQASTSSPIHLDNFDSISRDTSMDALHNNPLSDFYASSGLSWRHISLRNHEITIAILKRLMQLSGIRVSDSVIASAATTGELLDRLLASSKPRKVLDALDQDNGLVGLSNVNFQKRRAMLIDRERSIGRWKIVEEQLRAQELPAPKLRSI